MIVLSAVKPLVLAETDAATAVLLRKLGVSVTEAWPKLSVMEVDDESIPLVDAKSTCNPEIGIPYWSRTVAVILDEETWSSVTIEELALINRFVTVGGDENFAVTSPFPLTIGVMISEVRSSGFWLKVVSTPVVKSHVENALPELGTAVSDRESPTFAEITFEVPPATLPDPPANA